MPTILSQIKELRKKIKIPWRVVYVDRVIEPEEFQEKTIYVHIWIEGENYERLGKGLGRSD
jgi:hypothetical protein